MPATLLGGLSFGVLAQPVMGSIAPVVMSLFVFSGAAQFAALTVLATGGGALAAIARRDADERALAPDGPRDRPVPERRTAAALGRVARASSTPRSRSPAAATAPTTASGSSVRRAPQFVAWSTGTLIGVLGGSLLGDPKALGLDAMFPAFFAVLLFSEVRDRVRVTAAALGAGIAFLLMPFAPGRHSGRRRRVRGADRPQAGAAGDGVTAVWITIAVLAVGTFAAKATGTLVLGTRDLPPRALNVTALLAPALLAGLLDVRDVRRRGRARHRRPCRRARRRDRRDPRPGADVARHASTAASAAGLARSTRASAARGLVSA